jgi:prephenate dehydratase
MIMNETVDTLIAQKIAIQGYEGSFHQIAAEGYFHKDIDIVPCQSFSELALKCSQSDVTDAAVMAIENSIAGSILSNYHLLQVADLYIKGEIYLQIKQQLMALPGQSIDDIHEVRSHPMAIYQCREYFKSLPDMLMVETEDTALSAKKVRDQNLMGVAAIASEKAARLYDLEIIASNIETVHNNYTRFLILGRKANEIDASANKASLYFGVNHEPGSLAKILTALANVNVNVSKIQSFPVIKKEWEYYFHLDIEFDSLEQYELGIEALKAYSNKLRVLGVYQKGKTL